MNQVLEVLHQGALGTVQDGGRLGQRHLGIPPAGALDKAALQLANRLLDNLPNTPVLECLAGARFRALVPVQIGMAGFGHARAWRAQAGEIVEISAALAGVWSYLALPGGVDAARWLGSSSVCLRAGIGSALAKGMPIACASDPLGAWRQGIVQRSPISPLWATQKPLYDDSLWVKARPPARSLLDYTRHRPEGWPPTATCGQATEDLTIRARPIRVWPGPQYAQFSAQARQSLCRQAWQVTRQSDRSGYRLEGEPLHVPEQELFSEPVRIGAIQVPPDGQPIVCLNDGPTVGGYPKIGIIDPADLRFLVQTRPGETLRFTIVP